MYDEYNALIKNSTWILVSRPPNVNVVLSMWLFRHKYHVDGSLSRYKDRLVANGSSQQFGVDCGDTFSPVIKLATIRTILSVALSRNWPIHQLDVKNAFLNGKLSKTVYMYQPSESKLGANGDPYNRFVSICKITESLIFRLLSVFTDMFVARWTMGFNYMQSTSSLVAYFDADWAGYPTTRSSTSGYCVFFGDNLLPWSSKRQHTLSRSSAEAEYRGVVNVVAETARLRNILHELHMPLLSATLVYCDNVSAIYLIVNPVPHQRTKHIEIDIHLVRDMVVRVQVRDLHVPSRYQYADIFTKRLPSTLLKNFIPI
uniref:NBS-containing resistance-like protein n=1 Tax=Tanacetum cinerariifolium TaxID=118510 RepID=A0A6L2M1W3_TANCI|nr:NBS-containing resistance-like protein [Tanacetum cinerariifolium]